MFFIQKKVDSRKLRGTNVGGQMKRVYYSTVPIHIDTYGPIVFKLLYSFHIHWERENLEQTFSMVQRALSYALHHLPTFLPLFRAAATIHLRKHLLSQLFPMLMQACVLFSFKGRLVHSALPENIVNLFTVKLNIFTCLTTQPEPFCMKASNLDIMSAIAFRKQCMT